MTTKQITKAVAQINTEIAALTAIEATYAATFTGTVTDEVGAAWNATHDAIEALTAQRDAITNARRISGAHAATWALIQKNMD